jgi:pimeloyl-ACP methyl ester carboxylesterase
VKVLLGAVAAVAVVLLLGFAATWTITRRIEASFPPTGRFVEVEGGRLHYVEAGPQGRRPRATVVLLHGASSTHAETMLPLGRRLAQSFRVISLDRPGHGWSDRVDGAAGASPARQAEIIGNALVKLNAERAIVVAHSWAGAVLPNLALDHADVVAGTVYLAPVTHPWPGGEIAWYYGPAAHRWVGWLLTRTLTTPAGILTMDWVVRAVFAPQEPPPDYVEAARIPLALRPSVFRANAEDVAGLYAAVASQRVRYPEIRVPTVIIAGDADTIVRTDIHARGLARDVPGAKLIVLPGVGHMPHHAAPDLVTAEIEALAAGLANSTLTAD